MVMGFYAQVSVEVTKYNPSCYKGCNRCCYHPIWVSPLEGLLVTDYLERLQKQLFKKIQSDWHTWIARLRNENFDMFMTPNGAQQFSKLYFERKIKCPCLQDGICAIYEARPLVCRAYFTTLPPESCKHSETDHNFMNFFMEKRLQMEELNRNVFCNNYNNAKKSVSPLLFMNMQDIFDSII